jgi:hypothetical protein
MSFLAELGLRGRFAITRAMAEAAAMQAALR